MIRSGADMKRDMDLVRALLMTVESYPTGFAPDNIEVSGYTQEQIAYHAYLLNEAGLVHAIDVTTMGAQSPEARIVRLTWEGHEFLDAAREPSRWEQTKDLINNIGGASIPVWMALLTEFAKKSLGL